MFNIASNGIVTVNRGDSFTLPIVLRQGSSMVDELYELTPQDTLYIGIMEPNQPFETAILRKKVSYADTEGGNIQVYFNPNDTQCLLPGKYYYQVKLESKESNGTTYVETVIDKTLFYIKE